MNDLDQDLDLERRLRGISADPQPDVSSQVYQDLRRLERGEGRALAGVDLQRVRPVGGRRAVLGRPRVALAGLAAVLVLVVAASALSVVARPGAPAAAPAATPEFADLWSGLEWHDVSSTAFQVQSQFFGGIYGSTTVVWHGKTYHSVRYLANPNQPALWSSEDGSHWQRLTDAPAIVSLVSTPNVLMGMAFGTREGCLPLASQSGSWTTCAIWYSTDGVAWKQAKLPGIEGKQISTMAAAGSIALVGVRDVPTSSGPDPITLRSPLFASSDGANWVQVVEPPDMAGALQTSLAATRGGFVFSGFAPDPAGLDSIGGYAPTGSLPPDGTVDTGATVSSPIAGTWTAWFSKDGTSWSPYERTDSHPLAGQNPVGLACNGKAGDAMPYRGLHSSDGVSWSRDSSSVGPFLPGACSSNGTEVVFVLQGAFYVGVGDGRWQKLVNTGDVGTLPYFGLAFAVPNGVVYDSGGRVYFGRALTGTITSATLVPAH